jgi:hypothetical protein
VTISDLNIIEPWCAGVVSNSGYGCSLFELARGGIPWGHPGGAKSRKVCL